MASERSTPLKLTSADHSRTASNQPSCAFRALLLEHLLPTFLQCRAAALPLLFYKRTHTLDVLQHRIEFDNLPPLQLLPTDRRWCPSAKPKEEFLDLTQREASLPRPLNHYQAVQYSDIVASLSAHSLRRRKNPDLFVIADRRRTKSNLLRYLRNTQRHGANDRRSSCTHSNVVLA